MGSRSSSVGCCQSIGAMRSSKLDDFLNFHLRMIVQPIKTAATEPAMTPITVMAVLETEVVADEPRSGAFVFVGTAVSVTLTMTLLGEWAAEEPPLPEVGDESELSLCCCWSCCC